MRVLMWDVHGGYTDALLAGDHDYVFLPPEINGRGGLARYRGHPPATAREVDPEELQDKPPDVIVLQRLEEIAICQDLGLRPGSDVPAVFLEHNLPRRDVPNARHPMAYADGSLIVHVSHFNDLLWDCGTAPTTVIEHGLPDPGPSYTGEVERAAFVVNEPVRRWRVTGTDLLPRFRGIGVDAYGIDADRLSTTLPPGTDVRFAGNLSPDELRIEVARRRLYLHLNRWTSLGLSLIEAMLLGVPVVVLDSTEASRAVPDGAGIRSADVDELVAGARRLLADPDEAAELGRRARDAALARYGLDRFLRDWDAAFTRAAG